MVDLVCVDPAIVHQVWPLVSHFVRSAMDCDPNGHFVGTQRSVLNGTALLWVCVSSDHITAAVVTELRSGDRGKYCVVVAAGGAGPDAFLSSLATIEQFAKNEGCVSMEITGRKGWARVFPDYRVASIVLSKELN